MTANAQGGWKRGTAVLVAVGVVAACGDTSGESRAEVEPSPPVAPRPAGPEPLVLPIGGPPVALAPEAAASWQLRELVHLPRYFQLVGWKDSATLWGRAGCNPVEVRVDAPEYRAWDVPACGGAASAPGGERLAWGDGKGRLWVGERGRASPLVLDSGTVSPSGEGDPTGLILWSPDGGRILTSWASEAGTSFAVVDVPGGELSPVATRTAGYRQAAAWDWIDRDRILFTVEVADRPALAVADLRDGSFRAVAEAPAGALVRPVARWGETAILVGEGVSGSDRFDRFATLDTGSWSSSGTSLPPGASVVAASPTTALVLAPQSAGDDRSLTLWRDGTIERLAVVRAQGSAVAWSPDGSRLVVTGTIDEPVPGQQGSYVTRYVGYVIEPR